MTLPDADSLSTYGGPYANYGTGPVDPTTDLDANLFNKLAATAAMASRMVDRCEVAFVYSGSAATVSSFEAVWKGNSTTTPTITRTATGTFTITWPSSVQDELLASHALNLSSAFGWAQGATNYHLQASCAGNVITLYVFNTSGTLTDPTGITLRVRAR